MLKQTLSLAICLSLSFLLSAQDHRTIDGTQNNVNNTSWGSVGEEMPRITRHYYSDGISEPGGIGLANPRVLSNEIFAQDSLISDQLNLSDYVWVFGQFIDHDVTSVTNDPTESLPVPVDFPDEYFNPGGIFPNVEIPMHRSMAVPGTGTDTSNPREYFNSITSWIDASNVYGSDIGRANWLRTFSDGKLKTSAGNLLPYNTIDGESGSAQDPSAPFMDNENPFVTEFFIAGDSRANENTLLTSVHTLFVREHNRLCDELKLDHPNWTDELLYQEARRWVGAHIQAITYQEWLPAMGITMPDYAGYDATINATVSNIFSGAAFRLGHTLLNSNLRVMDNDGNNLGDIALKDAFFTPSVVANNGIDVFFIGMAEQVEQEMDGKIVDDVRNFLFGPPLSGIGGLDLAAININRGRERGIAPFNIARADIGLTPYSDINDFCSNPEICTILSAHYGSINQIDAWVGMLLEDHMPGMLFGETIMDIMMKQFGDLREGDRFYYENETNLSNAEIAEITATTFRDIIMRNTGVTIMQENVFEAMPHDSICMAENAISDINGAIQTWNGLNTNDVEVTAINVDNNASLTGNTAANGAFSIDGGESCKHYTVTPYKNTLPTNGISTFDLVKITKHILETELLDSPYKIIAADANNNGEITTIDIVELRKLLLFIDTAFANNTSWRFVDADYTFADPTDPLNETFPESKDIASLDESNQLNFVALKIGDINGSADPDLLTNGSGDVRTDETLVFKTIDRKIKAGELVQLPIRSQNIARANGFQFTLEMDETALAFNAVYQQNLPNLSAGNFNFLEKENLLLGSWNGSTEALDEEDVLFTFQFEALKDGQLSDFVQLNSKLISAEAYSKSESDALMNVSLYFSENSETINPTFVLHQNQPNPFEDNTIIGFELPGDSEVTFSVTDVTGRLIQTTTEQYSKGYQQIELDAANFGQTGSVFYYKIETVFGTATKKMIVIK